MNKKLFDMLVREHLKGIKKGVTIVTKDPKKRTMVEKGIPEYGGSYINPLKSALRIVKSVK